MLDGFYRKKKSEIISLVRRFVISDFYKAFPVLKGRVSIIIVGSVATAHYDEHSDVDIEIFFPTKMMAKKYLPHIKKYKQHIRARKEPIQIHTPKVYNEIKKELLSWEYDDLLRVYSRALIVVDVRHRFRGMQKAIRWYPNTVYREKIKWLFAETIFQIEERFKIAVERKNRYFIEVVKLQIIRLFLNTVLLLHKTYPSFDKHLYKDVEKVRAAGSIMHIVDRLISERDIQQVSHLIAQGRDVIEQSLHRKRYITKKSDEYWIALRPRYQVKLG